MSINNVNTAIDHAYTSCDESENYHSRNDYGTQFVFEECGVGENKVVDDTYDDIENEQRMIWNHSSILLLLDEYQKRIDKFRNPRIKKKTLWKEMANVMIEKGYKVNTDILDKKFRNMKSTFLKIKENKKKNLGRGKMVWGYYNKFDQMFADDKSVNHTNIVVPLPMTIPVEPQYVSVVHQVEKPGASSSSSFSNSSEDSQAFKSNCREKQKRLDTYRKRQLKIEEKKLEELKRIRLEIEESNRISREKLTVFKQYLEINQNNENIVT